MTIGLSNIYLEKVRNNEINDMDKIWEWIKDFANIIAGFATAIALGFLVWQAKKLRDQIELSKEDF